MRKTTKSVDERERDERGERTRFGRLGGLLGYNLTRGHLAGLEAFAEAVDGTGLRPSELAVLLLVEANPGIKQTTLADVLAVDRSTRVRIVDRCEMAKWVRRGSSHADRRVAPPLLTASGRALLETIFAKIARAEERLSTLSAAERRTLLRLLRKMNGTES